MKSKEEKKIKVLVTGANGFIGLNLIKELVKKKKYEIRCLIRSDKNLIELQGLGVEVIYGDTTNRDSLKNICKDIEVVFHLAAKGDIVSENKDAYKEMFKINVVGTKNLLIECKNVKKFVHFSSIAAVGFTVGGDLDERVTCRPEIPYEKSKYESEQVVKKFCEKSSLKYTIIRPTMVYGEFDLNSETLQMCKLCQKHMFPLFGGGKNLMNPTYVGNVVQAVIHAIETSKSNNQIYFISDQRAYTLKELIDEISRKLNVKQAGFYFPLWIAKLGVIILEPMFDLFNKTPPITKRRMNVWKIKSIYSIDKAKKELNYNPISLKEGISHTVDWYKLNHFL